MSRGYRAYIRVPQGDDGRPLGRAGLEPVAANLNAHTREVEVQGFRIKYDAFSVRTHLGRPAIVMEVDEAWQVRVALPVARRFLTRTGWRYQLDANANTRRAM